MRSEDKPRQETPARPPQIMQGSRVRLLKECRTEVRTFAAGTVMEVVWRHHTGFLTLSLVNIPRHRIAGVHHSFVELVEA